MRSRKNGFALAALAAGALAWPAGAEAATVAITGDDGAWQGIGGQTLRTMAPQIAIGINGTSERSYSLQVVGPGGQVAAQANCYSSATPRPVTYQGNGVYTVNVAIYGTIACTDAPRGGTTSFAISAGVALGAPSGRLLMRRPGEVSSIEHRIPIAGNPGADTYDVFYSANPALAPDGSLVGPSREAFIDRATATVPLRFSEPGTYSVIARARVFGGAATPWTAPIQLRVVAPFDFASSTFPDSRGPSYRLRVRLREDSTRGRVRIEVARGWKGKARYRRLGTVRVRNGVFTKRFTLRRTGTYRMRYRFLGSSTTAAGTVVERIRIRRTVRFSASDGADHTLTHAAR